MAYQVLARKWRPQTFNQLVGQLHISQTLQNAVRNQRLPQALLFTGPRGTGKTSTARILAKSLRCRQVKDFNPCNQCKECEDIAASRSVDVMEIDGASNNGVDAIRELREGVSYRPSSGQFKVYIIDEVHMLSTSAFNALLKTLEEPPEHVIFIMATTEVHKIPQTILSRCQRFDFRRIPTRAIADHLQKICEVDNIKANEEALWIIARQGDGSMRDSQSLLDQVMTFSDQDLNVSSVTQILGLTDRSLLLETCTALVERNEARTLECLEKIFLAGTEPFLFVENLLENLRNLAVIKIAGERATDIVELPDSEIRFLRELGSSSSQEDLQMLFDMALKGAGEIDRSSEPRLVLEMLLIRMAAAPRIVDLQKLLQSEGAVPIAAAAARPAKAPSPEKAPEAPKAPLASDLIKTATGLNPTERWLELVKKARQRDILFAAKIENLLFQGLHEKTVELAIPIKLGFLKDQMSDPDSKQKLQSLIDQTWGPGYAFEIKQNKDATTGKSAQKMKEEESSRQEKSLMEKLAEHPKVQKATKAFNGQVKSVQPQKGETL